ncbi:hypothetical protein E2C01_063420 [Portunus trituberculatus]|uniref:Uncharacterized protein n=1 Tax=Portunus trituberculatus TaxID=210409 RepID=A0A5B7HKT4_PORTR|nr:hypothetical protein [Portunus trituberculatus]
MRNVATRASSGQIYGRSGQANGGSGRCNMNWKVCLGNVAWSGLDALPVRQLGGEWRSSAMLGLGEEREREREDQYT